MFVDNNYSISSSPLYNWVPRSILSPLYRFLSSAFLSHRFLFASRGLEAESLTKYSFVSCANRKNLKMEQNETGCQAPQAPVLCVNNCGFFGTAATMNMCSKCYKDMVLKEQQAKLAASSIESIVNESSNCNGKSSNVAILAADAQTASPDTVVLSTQASAVLPATEKNEEIKEGPKRCSTCRKRVGLMGFNCRCGNLFCAVHRYSDKHECPFDYHAAGQESIAKANPVVRAEKLDKI